MFVGNVLVSDLRALFDVTAFCLMAAAMLSENFLLILICLLLSYFTDERALIASPLIFIWFVVIKYKATEKSGFYSLLKPDSSKIALISSWPIYFSIRYLLGSIFGLSTGTVGAYVFAGQINNIMFGWWTGLEGFWIIVFACFILLYIKKDWLLGLLLFASIMAVSFIAFSVIDITRSMAYLFPVIFISLRLLKMHESELVLQKIALLVFIVCLFPTYYTDGEGTILYYYPLPFRIVGIFTH